MKIATCISRGRSRRGFLGGLAVLLLAPLLAPRRAGAQGRDVVSLVPPVKDVLRGMPARPGRVEIDTPLLAENGHSVSVTVTVQSPMTAADHVRSLYLVSEKNPRPLIARFDLGPRAGRAEVYTRIRLAGSQHVAAVAQMADGSFWYATAEVNVTESACLDAS